MYTILSYWFKLEETNTCAKQRTQIVIIYVKGQIWLPNVKYV